jgi:hypothetical protein
VTNIRQKALQTVTDISHNASPTVIDILITMPLQTNDLPAISASNPIVFHILIPGIALIIILLGWSHKHYPNVILMIF